MRMVPNHMTESGFSYVALCAAESLPEEGDVYLNDSMHGALTEKFEKDFKQMGFMK